VFSGRSALRLKDEEQPLLRERFSLIQFSAEEKEVGVRWLTACQAVLES
jgi:hypothetical protein